MKLKDAVWLILLVVVLLSGCHTKVVYVVAPDQVLAVAYADAGATITWKPEHAPGKPGNPFRVKKGKIPCLESDDKLVSDGKKSVVCHLNPSIKGGGTYRFTIVPDPPPPPKKTGGKDPVVVMHVGPCTGCTAPGTPSTPGTPGTPAKSVTSDSPSTTRTTLDDTASRPVVGLYCDDSNNSQADPPDLTVDKDAEVHWRFEAGNAPTDGKTPPFTVTLDPGVCSNYPDGTKITTNGDFCKVSKSNKYPYHFTVYGCNPSPLGQATITLP